MDTKPPKNIKLQVGVKFIKEWTPKQAKEVRTYIGEEGGKYFLYEKRTGLRIPDNALDKRFKPKLVYIRNEYKGGFKTIKELKGFYEELLPKRSDAKLEELLSKENIEFHLKRLEKEGAFNNPNLYQP